MVKNPATIAKKGRGLVVLAAVSFAAVAAVAGSRAEELRKSPLAAYAGFGHNPVADEARFLREDQAREGMIANCMRLKGFEYFPSPAIRVDGSLSRERAWELSQQNPNNRYVASLSPARREEYSLALAGVPDANDPGLKHVGGCLAEAHRALPGVYAAYGALLEPFEKLQEQIAADPRVVGAEARWSDCMRRRGLSFGRPRDVVAFVDESQPQARTDVGRAELMQQHARAFAVAGLCRREANLDATIAEVRYDHEARFVERYKEVLERYRG